MRPRKIPDIGWRDLACAATACLLPPARAAAQAQAEDAFGRHAALGTLSVRSGFDLLLRCLRLPAGSEVLVSAVTIRDMATLLRHHGLRPVPVDPDPRTCAIGVAALEAARTPSTRAILVAHLYGTRMDMAGISAFAQRHGLLLLEDCAQAHAHDGWRGSEGTDVSMFSFGPIKTATALGGGMLRFRDAALRDACAALQQTWPMQARMEYLRRVLKYAAIKLLCVAPCYSAFVALCRAAGREHDRVISAATRGFAGRDLFDAIRRQPSTPLLATMARRLRNREPRVIDARIAAAHAFRVHAGAPALVGGDASPHAHWVFPIASRDPDALVRLLWRHGFDATRGATSLHAIPQSADGGPSTREAERMMASVVYLPLETAALRQIDAIAALVTAFESAQSPEATAR